MSNKFALFFRPQFSVKLPRFAKISKKVCSFLCSLSLITNIFLPYFSVIPVYATDTGFFSTQIEYSASSHKLSITTNSSEKIEYQLFYKTVDKIDSIAGIDLAATNISDAFYLGTCSAESICLPQDFSRGVLKLKSFANQIFSQSFTLENNTLTIVKEGDSFQFDLTDEENNFLSPWTFENVELNKEYENSGVKLTFTELPENSGNIKIQEITLIPEQIEQTGAISDKAYDITSDMSDGTFEYNLSLPIPESSKEKDVDIKFAESISEIDTAQTVDNTINSTASSVSVVSLDHMTIFIITGSSPPSASNIIDDGDTNFSTNGSWSNYTAGINSDHKYTSNNTAGNWARWTFTDDQLPVAGQNYTISAHWVVWSDHVTDAIYKLYNNSNVLINTFAAVDQSKKADGGNATNGTLSGWKTFSGTFTLQNGYYVQLETNGINSRNVVADAVKIETVGSLSKVWVDKSWSSHNNGDDLGSDKVYGYNAFSNIQTAISAVSIGGTINIASGTYNESQIIIDKPLTLQSTDGNANTIIDGGRISDYGIIKVTAGSGTVTISGFTIQNANNTTDHGHGINVDNGGVSSVNVEILNNIVKNVGPVGIRVNDANSVKIEGNAISLLHSNHDVIPNGIQIGWPNGSGITGTIKNNTISGCSWVDYIPALGYEDNTGGSAGILIMDVTAALEISDNDIHNNDVGIDIEAGASTITNNNIHDNYYGVVLWNENPSINNNKIVDNTTFGVYRTPSGSLSGTVDATKNWWGHMTGPSGIEIGLGDAVSANVTYEEWFCEPCPSTKLSVNGVCSLVNVPAQTGYNYNDGTSADQPRSPNQITCTSGFTNVNGVSIHWTNVSNGDVRIKYQRQYNLNGGGWSGNEIYTIPYTSYRTFGGGTGAEGHYGSRVRAFYDTNDNNLYDSNEPVSDWSNECAITYDKTAPTIPSNLSYSTTNSTVLDCGNITNQYNIVAKWSASTDTNFSNYEYKSFNPTNGWIWNGGNIGNTLSRSGAFTVGEGTYGFAVRAVDKAGNVSNWTSENLTNSCQIIYDVTKPLVQITKPENNSIVSGIVDIKGTITETNPHHYWLAIYRQSDNSSIFSTVVNHSNQINDQSLYNWDTTTQVDGLYQIKFAERDNADNRSTDYIVNVTVDNTPPVITVNPFITNSKTPSLSGTINDNTASISVQVNSITYTGTNNGDGTWGVNISNTLPDGTYNIIASAADTAGNIGNDVTSDELIVDTIAPIATYKHYIDNVEFKGSIAYVNNLNKLTFTGEYSDFNPSSQLLKDSYVIFDAQTDHSFNFSQNGAKAYCSWRTKPNLVDLSGNLFSLTTKELFSNCISNLPDDEYYIAHQVYDNAVRHDIPSITQFRDVIGLHFIIDTVNPSSKISLPINNGTNSVIYSNSWDGSISGTASDDISGIMGVKVSIQNGLTQYFDGSGFNSATEILLDTTYLTGTWEYSDLTTPLAGSYTIRSHAIDNAGNTENTYTLTIILDKTIDEVTLSINPSVSDASNGWYKTQPTVTLTQTDDNFDRIEYQWDSQSGNWTTYSNPFKPASEGAHVLYYRAVDKANNISTVGVKNIKWDQTDLEYGPQNISANPNPTSTSTSKITWEAARDNIGIDKYEVQWSLNGLNYSKTVGAGTTEVEIDQLTEGRWTVKVIAFDGSGRTKDNSIDVVVDRSGPIAPVLTLAGTGVGTATLSWNTVSDAKDYIVWYGNSPGSRLYGARVGNVTTYTVKGLGAGNYYFIVKAVDEAQNQGAESNEVNTGTIAGVLNVEPNTPAEGFTPEVLGIDTGKLTTPTPSPAVSVSDVLGVSVENTPQWYWLWLLLLIPLYLILRRLFKRNQNN